MDEPVNQQINEWTQSSKNPSKIELIIFLFYVCFILWIRKLRLARVIQLRHTAEQAGSQLHQLSHLGPGGKQVYCPQWRILPDSLRDVWCLLWSLHSPTSVLVSPQLCHSWLLLATSMFLLVDSMAARRLRPHAERQCAMEGYVLGFWRTKALSSSSSSVWELLLLGASHLTSQCLHFLLYRKEVTTGPKSWGCFTDSVR